MPEMMVWPDSSSVSHPEGRVFLRQLLQGDAHLFLVGLGLRLHRDGDHRLRELHALQRDDVLLVHKVSPVVTSFRPTAAAMSPARTSLISSRSLECICRMRPMRFFLALDRVVDRVAGLQHAGVDAEETSGCRRRGSVAILKASAANGASSSDGAFGLALVVENTLDRRHVGRRRHELDHGIQHGLHALVLEGGAAQHRHDLVAERARAQTLATIFVAQIAGFRGRPRAAPRQPRRRPRSASPATRRRSAIAPPGCPCSS